MNIFGFCVVSKELNIHDLIQVGGISLLVFDDLESTLEAILAGIDRH
jgi:hypothetical protein